jgi:hypothetical protein
LRRYSYWLAPLGDDIKQIASGPAPSEMDGTILTSLGIECYSTIMVVAPDDVRAKLSKPVAKQKPKVKLSIEGKNLKSIVGGGLDNSIIMDTLAECNGDVNRALEKLLKVSADMARFEPKQPDKPISAALIKQVKMVFPGLSDELITSGLKKNGSDASRTIEYLLKATEVSPDLLRRMKMLFPQVSDIISSIDRSHPCV